MKSVVAARTPATGRCADGELSVAIFQSFDDLASVREEWDDFVEASGSDIYFTIDWLETWWRHYGGGRELRCFVLRQRGTVVAALPFSITALGIRPVAVRLARWVGADCTISVLYPAIAPGYEGAALDLILRHLLGDHRCDAVSLSPLSGLSPVGNAVQELCRGDGAYCIARDCKMGPHIVFSLPDSFQEYLAKLTKKARSNFRRQDRQLSAHYCVGHHVVTGRDMTGHFDTFAALHKEQWRAVGRLGHFDDWPGGHAFNRELVAKLGWKGHVRFHKLSGDGEVMAMQFGFVLGDRYYWRLPARRMTPTNEKLGSGQIGLVKMVEALMNEGVRNVEAGPGYYWYKLVYGGIQHPLRCQVIARRTWPARSKTKVLLHWSDAIHLLYYRLWFLKLSHLMRLPPRPLRQFWIRSRV